MKKRVIVLLAILACLLVVQTTLIFASQKSIPNYYYSSQLNSSLPGNISVRFKNGIDITQKNAGAETWTSYPYSDASVTATFYWVDRDSEATGTCYKTQGGSGAVEVYGDSLVNTSSNSEDKIYYKVISSHLAGYGGVTTACPQLQTLAP